VSAGVRAGVPQLERELSRVRRCWWPALVLLMLVLVVAVVVVVLLLLPPLLLLLLLPPLLLLLLLPLENRTQSRAHYLQLNRTSTQTRTRN
jgi:hypothetical protein